MTPDPALPTGPALPRLVPLVIALAIPLLAAPAVAQSVTARAPSAAQAPSIPPATPALPVFEAGLAAGGGWLPDYPAAGQNHLQGLAFPYLIYRGEILRSDDQGVRGRFYQSDAIGLDLSFSGAFPTSSDRNDARKGMPDLDWQGEVGPSLRITLWRDQVMPQRVNLELPLRAVFSTDLSSVHYRGITASPELAYERQDLGRAGSRLRVGLGPVFGTERLMDYYYEVDDRYARADRPAYRAEGGYLGSRLQFSYRVPVTDRVAAVAGGRVESFHGAANDESPLFRRDWNLSLVLGFSWALYRSEATVASTASPFD